MNVGRNGLVLEKQKTRRFEERIVGLWEVRRSGGDDWRSAFACRASARQKSHQWCCERMFTRFG
jgi:hypothetical protein